MKRIRLVSTCFALLLAACSADGEGEHSNNCVGSCDVGLDDARARDVFAPAEPGDWTTFRSDTYRTGYAPESTVGDDVEEVWSRSDFMARDWSAVKSSGSVWDDVLYYPSDRGTMYAFDRMTGDVIWSKELIDRAPGIHSSPQVTASTVFIGTYTGTLHCLDRDDGDEIWTYRIGNVIGSSPLYVPEHNALYVSHEIPKEDPLPGGGYVTKNDPRTGEEIWVSPKLHHWPHASVSVDPERKVVTVGANDGVFHGYDTDTGEELWSRDFESEAEGQADIKTTGAISKSRGLVYVGTWDRNVYALDLEDGSTEWTFETGGGMQGSPALDEENGVVYVGSPGSPSVFAIDADTGEEIWSASIGSVASSPAISGDRSRIVVGTNSETLVALDAETGDVVWEFQADGPVTASPTLVGDMIYVAARKGSLYALRTF